MEHNNIIELYKQLDLTDKINQFGVLIQKTNDALNNLLRYYGINPEDVIQKFNNHNPSREEILYVFYENLLNVKDKALALSVLCDEQRKNNN